MGVAVVQLYLLGVVVRGIVPLHLGRFEGWPGCRSLGLFETLFGRMGSAYPEGAEP